MKKYLLLGILFALLSAQVAYATIPQLISIQGRLTDSAGTPISGTRDFQFEIVNSTSTVWGPEAHSNVQVTNGIFNVTLGSVNPISIPSDQYHYLRVYVYNTTEAKYEQFPLLQITSSGYAFWAQNANWAASLDCDGCVALGTETSGILPVSKGGTGVTSVSARQVLIGPSAAGAPTWRILEAADIPDLAASKITSGTFDTARIPDLAASKITSGTFGVARGGTGLSSLSTGGILYISAADTLSRIAPTAANQVLRSTGANALTIGSLVADDIPSLAASKITSGRFGMAQMPTGTSTYVLTAKGAGVDPAWEPAPSGDGGGGTVTNVDTSAPLTGGPITTTGTIGIAQASSTTSGYLSLTDWNTFNNKVSKSGDTMSGNLTFNAANKGVFWIGDAIKYPHINVGSDGYLWVSGNSTGKNPVIIEGPLGVQTGSSLDKSYALDVAGTGRFTGALTAATIDTGFGAKEIGDTVGDCASTDVHKGDGGCEAESSLSVSYATSAGSVPCTGITGGTDNDYCADASGTGGISGSGTGTSTAGNITRWNGTSSITNSIIYENAGNVGIGTEGATNTRLTVAADSTKRWGIYSSIKPGTTVDAYRGVEGKVCENADCSVYSYGILGLKRDDGTYWSGFFNKNVSIGGYVGIGTASPSALLTVDRGTTGTNAAPAIRVNTSGTEASLSLLNSGTSGREYQIFSTSSTSGQGGGKFVIWDQTGSANRLTINSTGHVGIGTATPNAKLNIFGGYQTSGLPSTGGLSINSEGTSPDRAQIWWGDNTGWKLHFGTRDSSGNFVSRVTMVDTGNVGIGTPSPQTTLDVRSAPVSFSYPTMGLGKGGIHLAPTSSTGGYSNAITFGANGATLDNANAGIYVQSSGSYGTKMYFATTDSYATGAQSRMMIDHAGKVGIGTTSPGNKLEVNGSISSRYIPSSDTAQSNEPRVDIISRGSGGADYIWTLYTAPVGGGWGVNPNSFEIWEYPQDDTPACCIPRFRILESGSQTTSPSEVVIDRAGNLVVGGDIAIGGNLAVSGGHIDRYSDKSLNIGRDTSAGYTVNIGYTGANAQSYLNVYGKGYLGGGKIYLTHDRTDGKIGTDTGNLILDPSGKITTNNKNIDLGSGTITTTNTGVVTNLNADTVDTKHASDFMTTRYSWVSSGTTTEYVVSQMKWGSAIFMIGWSFVGDGAWAQCFESYGPPSWKTPCVAINSAGTSSFVGATAGSTIVSSGYNCVLKLVNATYVSVTAPSGNGCDVAIVSRVA